MALAGKRNAVSYIHQNDAFYGNYIICEWCGFQTNHLYQVTAIPVIMGNQSQEEKPNPSPKSSSFNKNNIDSLKRRKSEFEFCKACRLNHNQGQRHKYFPSHKKSTADFLARFRTKTEDIRFFLKNPSVLPSEYASRSRFWCIVCDEEIDELDSSFAWYCYLFFI